MLLPAAALLHWFSGGKDKPAPHPVLPYSLCSNDVHEALAGQLLGPACLVCQLRHIDVYGGVFEPPGLAAFPLLSSYTVDACKVRMDFLAVSSAAWLRIHWWSCWRSCVSRLTPVPQFAGTPKLRSACYQAGTLNLDGTFSYNRTARNPLLPPIMDALLPAGCSELGPPTRLELSCCELCSDAQACQQLASVHALHLCDCFTCGDAGDDSDSEDVWQEYDAEEAELGISFAALRSLLQQVQALTDLSIEECLGGDADALDAPALPAGLTLLCLRGNDLAEMPAGPYPEGELAQLGVPAGRRLWIARYPHHVSRLFAAAPALCRPG